ncbi:NADP-dependent oxidoreductase [Nocardioides sp. 1609]|uniref:NADP-dependent oxidoreductase n=1 Tax=Nocardioides sp. 1609 TaxID=2508327 RepID=UPI00106FBC97|nr:NADP-dependent oxidoreductase [Nocardioides sp. 1609]
METTQVRLAAYPVGVPADSDFEITTVALPELAEGQVLLRTIYLSLDPYVRGRMSTARSYADPLALGDVIMGGTVCEVVESRSEDRRVGDVVLAFAGWQTHAVADARHTRRLDPSTAPVSTALGVLGMPGFTAYAGLLEIGRPKPGETVVTAAAAGPVGSAVGQIAKLKGARAVGIAGGAEKCRVLVEELGFDVAVDHRVESFADDLAAATPDGIDVYFENVGGHVAEAVGRRLNRYARVPVCGLVAGYNDTAAAEGPDRLPGFMRSVLTLSLTVRGFIQDEFAATHTADFAREMGGWVGDGSVRYLEDVTDGLDQAPEAFRGLLSGKNVGKALVRVGADPTSAS